MVTTRYMDGMQLIRAVREFLNEHPEARKHLLWDDQPNYHRLTAGSRVWEIAVSRVEGIESFTTPEGRDKLLHVLGGCKSKRLPLRRYGNSRAWDFIRDPDDVLPIPHVHACPECYEYVPCEMACYLEPDLELDDGTPCGAHHVCGRCLEKTGTKTHFGRRKP